MSGYGNAPPEQCGIQVIQVLLCEDLRRAFVPIALSSWFQLQVSHTKMKPSRSTRFIYGETCITASVRTTLFALCTRFCPQHGGFCPATTQPSFATFRGSTRRLESSVSIGGNGRSPCRHGIESIRMERLAYSESQWPYGSGTILGERDCCEHRCYRQ
jgi:hypothetical protein